MYKYDVSLPTARMYNLVTTLRERLDPMFGASVKVLGYGHLGDEIYISTIPRRSTTMRSRTLSNRSCTSTRATKGSVSAEHGLGVMKAEEIHYSKDRAAAKLMATMKRADLRHHESVQVLPAAAVRLDAPVMMSKL